jgi:hypothetical protein
MTSERRVINIYDTPYSAYDLEGAVQVDMQLLNISYDRGTGRGLVRHSHGARRSVHSAPARVP